MDSNKPPNDSKRNSNRGQSTAPQNRRTVAPTVISSSDDETTSNENNNDGAVVETTDSLSRSEIDAIWTQYFPYETPYADQVDGIKTYFDALADYHNMVMEGACGTGKTLIALTAGITAIRHEDILAEHVSEETTDGEVYDAPDYSRVFAVTPVKQQLKQFIQEMKDINSYLFDNNIDAVNTIVLRGKGDMVGVNQYDDDELETSGETITIDELRKQSIRLIQFDSDIPLQWPDEVTTPKWSRAKFDWDAQQVPSKAEEIRDEYDYDPFRVEAIFTRLQNIADEENDHLIMGGVETPFPSWMPSHEDVISEEYHQETLSGASDIETEESSHVTGIPAQWRGKFDPFFIGEHLYETQPVSFADAESNVLDGDALITSGAEYGVCPHILMSELMKRAETIIGNYYHVFDEDTRMLTDKKGQLIDDDTICVVDEAHNIESNVRDILSDTCSPHELQQAINDISAIEAIADGSYGNLPESLQNKVSKSECKIASSELPTKLNEGGELLPETRYSDVTSDELSDVKLLLNELHSWLLARGKKHVINEVSSNWEYIDDPDPESISLESPTSNDIDKLVTRIERQFNDDIWDTMRHACAGIATAFDEVDTIDREITCDAVAALFYRWKESSHVQYFREIQLEPSVKDSPITDDHRWTETWTPKYQLYNCLPTDRTREVFSEFGSVLLMSATLEPFDVFTKTTGVDKCVTPRYEDRQLARQKLIRSGEADTIASEGGDQIFRDVVTRRYPLRFPRENRFSGIVPAQRFTSTNRGSPTIKNSEMSNTRDLYANIITDIATTSGNVLIAMPSYGEARWAARLLNSRGIDDRKDEILLDESSESWVTDETLQKFFDTDSSVLITSTRGTVTEGVDYDGDKLDACAVIGISLLPPTQKQKAIEYAYDECIEGINGRDATNAIPATRKARQAIGRVIRGDDEVGVRLLVDERYENSSYGGVNDFLSDEEKQEFKSISPSNLKSELQTFWDVQSMN